MVNQKVIFFDEREIACRGGEGGAAGKKLILYDKDGLGEYKKYYFFFFLQRAAHCFSIISIVIVSPQGHTF